MTSWTTDPEPPVRQVGPGWTTTPVDPERAEESPWFTRFTRVGSMVGDGNLVASVEPFIQGAALLRGDGALTSEMAGRHWRTGDVVSNGVLVGEVWSIRTRTADFTGDGLLEMGVNDGLSAIMTPGRGAKLEGRGDLTFTITGGNRIYPDGLSADVEQVTGVAFRDMQLSSIGYFGADLAQRVFRGVLHGAEGTLTASVLKVTDAQLSGGGTLSADMASAFTPIIEENTPRTNEPIPAGTIGCWVTLIGGGGGGGGGNREAVGTGAGGGGGGGGGGFVPRTFYPIASFGGATTYSVVVGARGTGAPSNNTNGVTGPAGTAGGQSNINWPGIGNNHIAGGGGGGGGGTSTTGGTVGGGGIVTNATGDAGTQGGSGGSPTGVGNAGLDNGASASGGAGGGGGGGESSTGGTQQNGGQGGDSNGVTGGSGSTGGNGQAIGSPIAGQAGPGAGGARGSFAGGSNTSYGGGGGGAGGSVGAGTGVAGTGGPGYTKIEWV